MKLSEYLKDKVYFIIVNLICISIIILLLLAFKVRFSLIMVVTFLFITENILLLMIDYFRKKNFYTSLIQKLEELDKKYLILVFCLLLLAASTIAFFKLNNKKTCRNKRKPKR